MLLQNSKSELESPSLYRCPRMLPRQLPTPLLSILSTNLSMEGCGNLTLRRSIRRLTRLKTTMLAFHLLPCESNPRT